MIRVVIFCLAIETKEINKKRKKDRKKERKKERERKIERKKEWGVIVVIIVIRNSENLDFLVEFIFYVFKLYEDQSKARTKDSTSYEQLVPVLPL